VFASRFGYYIPHSEYQVDCIVEEIYFMGNNAELRVRTYKDEELILMVEEGSSESLKVFENGNARLLNLQEHMPLIGKGSHLGVYGDYVGCGERVGRCFSPKRIYILPGSR
jgi:hypothetical protein